MVRRSKQHRPVNASVVAFVNLLCRNQPPDTIRKNLLSWVCKNTGARAAFLLIHNRTFRFGRIQPELYQQAIAELNASSDSEQNNGRVSLYKLQFSRRPFGTLGLKDSVSNTAMLSGISMLISLFEQRQGLIEILEISQNALRNVSHRSSLIARNNARLFQKLTSNMHRLQGMSKGVIRMQEEERSKISRELHDGIGQALTALKMSLDFVVSDLRKDVSFESKQQLEDARRMAEQSLGEVRELSRLLRPRMLDDLGLLPTLRWSARTFSNRTGIKVTVLANETNLHIDSEVETMLFRITQEGLNNIAKHSQSKNAEVDIRCSPGLVRLTISDDGVGFNASECGTINSDEFGSGLSGIRDRVALWGGKFMLESEPGAGTTLRIEVPRKYGSNSRTREKTKLATNG